MKSFLASASLICSAQSSTACAMAGGFQMEDIFEAQVVLLAEVLDYKQEEGWLARFRVRPNEILNGDLGDYREADGTLTITWNFNTFSTPEKVAQETLIFALRPAEEISLGDRTVYTSHPDFLTVVRRSCGPPHIFVPDGGLGERIAAIFDEVGDPMAEAQAIRADVFSGLPRVYDHPFVALKPNR